MTGQPEHPEKVAGVDTDPRFDGYRITELWAWTVVNPADDQEGVPSAAIGGVAMPMVTSKRHVAEQIFGPYAQVVADALGVPCTLRHFIATTIEPVAAINPSTTPEQRRDT